MAACGCGSSTCGCSDVTLPVGPRGYNGWSPILAVVEDAVNLDGDGNSRYVHQIVGWTGGSGITPTTYLNYYVGATGPVPLIINGVNIRGAAAVVDTSAWEFETITTYLTTAPTNVSTQNFAIVPVVGTFTVNSISSYEMKYKTIGKILFCNYQISGTAVILNVVETLEIDVYVKIPGGYTGTGSTAKVGLSGITATFTLPDYGGLTATQLLDLNVFPTNEKYIYSDSFILENQSGGLSSSFTIRGQVIMEID